MKVWTDKQGNKLTPREFIKRWKEGVMQINPYQQTKVQLNSSLIILIGVISGLIITFFKLKELWWLSIILAGGTANTLVQILGLWQKKEQLKIYYKEVKNGVTRN